MDVVDLKAALADMKVRLQNDKLHQDLLELCSTYDLDSETLKDNLESWHTSLDQDSNLAMLNKDQINRFAKFLVTRKSKSAKRVAGKKALNDDFLETPGSINAFSRTPLPGTAAPFTSIKKRAAEAAETPFPGKKQATSPITPPTHGAAAAGPDTPPVANPLEVVGSGYRSRERKGQVAASLHPHVPLPLRDDALTDNAVMLTDVHYPIGGARFMGRSTRFMNEDVSDRARFLDERVRRTQAALAAQGSARRGDAMSDGSYPVGRMAPEPVMVVGRILGDFLSDNTRLNETSVLVEGLASGGGQQVRVALEGLPEYSVFPGQVVALEGVNPTGSVFRAKRVVPVAPEAKAGGKEGQAEEEGEHKPAPLSILIAAGPFTPEDDLAFEPLSDLMTIVSDKRPDMVVLVGPFVPEDHPMVRQGLPGATFEQVFRERVRAAVLGFIKQDEQNGETRRPAFVLMPSAKDAHMEAVHPQPPLEFAAFDPRTREWDDTWEERDDPLGQVHLVPSPAALRAGGIVLAATSTDVIADLAAQEISRVAPAAPGAPAPDRLARLAAHLVQQRSFYPLFPPSRSVPMDYSLREFLAMPEVPNLMITPSKLQPFAKVATVQQEDLTVPMAGPAAEGADPAAAAPAAAQPVVRTERFVCINPGSLARGKTGGTYAMVHVNPVEGRDVADCTRAEIVYI